MRSLAALLYIIAVMSFCMSADALDYGRHAVSVAHVIDGDTVRVRIAGTGALVTVRLLGVDTPETRRAQCAAEARAGKAATRYTQDWLARPGAITLTAAGRDKYGRTLGRLTRGDSDLSANLLKAGHARPYAGRKREGWC